ncbi:carboxypeptidase-like regulatory domain-containing protein [Chitinophaga solisilvae]|uniref:carboxypeptidase-like regulatory domain-containing protein n=1 Tax=Chitinophaga solisilvae TaxID=1233460 RepID=UPI00136D5DC9|nr:carboxypeptidase-like regulatory domain-containing protein [Chitinophaga solisilvae]
MPFSRIILIILLTAGLSWQTAAQSLLNKTVSLEVKRQPLSEVLNQISRQGNFYFSYISNILPQDSLVSISVNRKSVRHVLDILFEGDYVYKESGNYIILLKKVSGQAYYQISGFVTDKRTGMRISNASVYERQQLISTLTNNDGYFRLRLKDKYPTAAISVSKELYADTSLTINTGQDQEVAVTISPVTFQLKTVEITSQVERTWLGRMLLSSRQKMQSMNLTSFLADKPYQASLAPGLGTHGKMGAQVVNKFSVNILGGYTAGVDGVEIGTGFNIVKGNVKNVQIAGIFNVVGGKTSGVQIAGLHNNVLDSMNGVQVGGFSNITRGNQEGVQISGVYGQTRGNFSGVQLSGVLNVSKGNIDGWQVAGVVNVAAKNAKGVQLSGIGNFTQNEFHGVQLTGIGNISKSTVKGVQLSTIFNYARRLDGVQVGLVNIADTTTGYSIGLINFVKKGYHKVSVFSTETLNLNVAWKSGRKELYSILLAGMNAGTEKAYQIGYGIGKEIPFNRNFFLAAEITGASLYIGDKDGINTQMMRMQPMLNLRLGKSVSIFAGPSFVMHFFDKIEPKEGFKTNIPGNSYPSFNMGEHVKGWLGWQAGITIL